MVTIFKIVFFFSLEYLNLPTTRKKLPAVQRKMCSLFFPRNVKCVGFWETGKVMDAFFTFRLEIFIGILWKLFSCVQPSPIYAATCD